MSKGKLFVTACSLLIIGMFVLFCFLMSTVNPPALPPLEGANNSKLAAFYLHAESDNNSPHDDGFAKSQIGISSLNRENSTNIMPIRLDLQRVIPPPWPTCPISSNGNGTTKGKDVAWNITDSVTQSAKGKPALKGRRSINNFEKSYNGNSGIINLKILDENGKSRIEIKLNSEESRKANNPTIEGPPMILHVQNIKDYNDITELAYNTEIKILPNDTVVIEGNDSLENNDAKRNVNSRAPIKSGGKETYRVVRNKTDQFNSIAYHTLKINRTVKTQ